MMERHEIKRFLEHWTADRKFREHYTRDPVHAVAAHNLKVDALACRVMVDPKLAAATAADQVHPEVKNFHAWSKEKVKQRARHRERCATSNPIFASWRQRQLNRYLTQVGSRVYDCNVHSPLTIELTLGCSVGCAYCGANAGKLRKIARFTPGNERLFRKLLGTLAEFLGPEADRGFLYYGTEPLDNPDYEKYLLVFYEELGATPQTTTAAWHRDVARTRRVLEQSRAHNGMTNRFSVNTLEQFYYCMANFAAAELYDVELILQNPESTNIQVAAGRGRRANPDAPEGTIACVSGFRVNLPERSIKLVTPTTDLARYPRGEMVLAQGIFEDAPSLRAFLQDCQQRVLQFKPGDDFVPHLRPDLEVDFPEEGKTVLITRSLRLTITDPLAQEVARLMDGCATVDQIVDALGDRHEPAYIYYTINKWWQNGYLDDPWALAEQVPASASRAAR